jgi:hypothetical protein
VTLVAEEVIVPVIRPLLGPECIFAASKLRASGGVYPRRDKPGGSLPPFVAHAPTGLLSGSPALICTETSSPPALTWGPGLLCTGGAASIVQVNVAPAVGHDQVGGVAAAELLGVEVGDRAASLCPLTPGPGGDAREA